MIKNKPNTAALIILDGWGYSESPDSNAILAAKKPNWDELWGKYPHTLIRASESAVGLPINQMGNSEVGHLNLGAGRVVHQEISRITHAIKSGSFFSNGVLIKAIDHAIENNKALHLLGLVSDGGVHSHINHIQAMIEMAAKRGAKKVYVHAFLDGRDTAPKSAQPFITQLEHTFTKHSVGEFASIIGRYYAMDRDHRWPRIKLAYDLIAHRKAAFNAPTAEAALNMAYERGELDEFVQASTIGNSDENKKIQTGDSVIFLNFRSDRARQIVQPFVEPEFNDFDLGDHPIPGSVVSLTEYKAEFDMQIAFPPERLRNVFGEYISKLGMHQLRIAETEKYAHVTFFMNGGIEDPYPGEERILIPSPDVATYDLQPEMNANKLTETLIDEIKSKKYDVIICNFANPDMVGHTGNFDATVKAIESLDECLGKIIGAIKENGGEAIITADHGNAELMLNKSNGQAHTAHTTNPVPFLYIGRDATLAETGALSDVAPSMLQIMGIKKPTEMGGQSLITLKE